MKLAVFSNRGYWTKYFGEIETKHQIKFFDVSLDSNTAKIASGYEAVCAFVNDKLDEETLKILKQGGTNVILMRSAGFNNVCLETADKLGMTVLRVPSYSPYAVAEFAVTLMMTLNRKIHKAYGRVRDGNYSLEGLVGFDMRGKTVGICGTGRIGEILIEILRGFGCRVIAYDVVENPKCKEMDVQYVSLDEIWRQSDIISLHTPLLKDTKHMINENTIAKMKEGVMIINTSRGGLIDTKAVIQGLKTGKVGYLGIDVYEEEGDMFFQDKSTEVLQDDIFARLMTFPNVIVTGHQAWFTKNALEAICETTINNLDDFVNGKIKQVNLVKYQPTGTPSK